MDTTLPPKFYTEQFWKELAAEWRDEMTEITSSGICLQASCRLDNDGFYYSKVLTFMKQYAPEHIKDKADYFFPTDNDESRPLRAQLCERIAADMKRLYGNINTNMANT